MLKSLCIGGAALGAAITARRAVRYICEPHGPAVDFDKIPMRDLKRSTVLSYLAYKEPWEIRKKLELEDLTTGDDYLSCIGDLCKIARAAPAMPVFFDGMPETSAQAFLWKGSDDERVVYVAFRGTEDLSDVLTDIDVRRTSVAQGVIEGAKVHNGFFRQYQSVRDPIMMALDTLDDAYDTVVFCGHSLGAALATIAAVDVASTKPGKVVKCHTCGSPRVGNNEFRKWFDLYVSENWRVYNANDPVSMIPLSHRFVHVSGGLCIDDAGSFRIIKGDVPWFVRPFVHAAYFDPLKPICDHDCKLYISRLIS